MVIAGRSGGSPRRRPATEERRRAILEAARTVFARQGYADTVVDDIARQAELAKGTLYLYFPSKEQIYLEALLEDARRLDDRTRAAMASGESWRDKLRAYLEVRLAYVEEHQDFVRIYLTEFRSMCLLGKPLNAELYRVWDHGEAHLAQMFAAAAARGEVRQIDPELAAATVTELTRGLIERRLREPGRAPCPSAKEFALDLLCRGLEQAR